MVKVLLVLHAGTYDNPLWPQEVQKIAAATCRRPAAAAAKVSMERSRAQYSVGDKAKKKNHFFFQIA